MLKWVYFVAIQLIHLVFFVIGLVVLAPFCVMESWWVSDKPSIKDHARGVDEWRWNPLNFIYGNPEDGVSGQFALLSDGSRYMPGANPAWRAYCWSALRNSVDGLKYVFTIPGEGPLVHWSFWKLHGKLGWQCENGYNVAVMNLKVTKVTA